MPIQGRDLQRVLAVHGRIARAYKDDRFPADRSLYDVRQFAITTLWVVGIECHPEVWPRVCEIMHLSDWGFWEAIRRDAPRWEPPEGWPQFRACEAPMVRRGGQCGKRGTTSFRVTNPADGTWHIASFCSRHEDYSREVAAMETAQRKAGGIPEPLPNCGGLLPCYFDWDWPDAYATAKPGWEPPRVGICADDWPVMAKVAAMEPPTLSVLEGGGEAAPLPSGSQATPSLRLIKS